MTAFELHLQVEQKLQEQGSYQRDRIFPEAIDLALNQADNEILEGIITEVTAGNKARLRHITPLMNRNFALTGITNYGTATKETNSVAFRVPAYVKYVMNCRGQRVTSTTCSDIPVYTSSNTSLYRATNLYFAEATAPDGSGYYYNNFKIVNAANVPIYVPVSTFTNRFTSTDQKYELINDILDTLNYSFLSYEAEWDSRNNSFVIYCKVNPTSLKLTYDNISLDTTQLTPLVGYTYYNMTSYEANTDLVIDYVPAKFVPDDHSLHQRIHLNRFTAPKAKEPLYTIASNTVAGTILYVFHSEDSIVTNVHIDYIRNPRKISLILDRTSELDPSCHYQIVNRAVEILKQNIQDPSVAGDVQLNQLNTRK